MFQNWTNTVITGIYKKSRDMIGIAKLMNRKQTDTVMGKNDKRQKNTPINLQKSPEYT